MPTKNRLVAVMTTLALAALSTSANATISTPFGSISAGGFSLNSPYPWNFGVGAAPASANQANAAGPSFGLWSPFFGLGQNDQQTLSVKTPFGGFYGPGFGLNPYGIGMGLGQQQALSVK